MSEVTNYDSPVKSKTWDLQIILWSKFLFMVGVVRQLWELSRGQGVGVEPGR